MRQACARLRYPPRSAKRMKPWNASCLSGYRDCRTPQLRQFTPTPPWGGAIVFSELVGWRNPRMEPSHHAM